MKFSNIIEKLGIIFNLIIDSKILTILTFLIIGTILLRLFNLTNNKKTNIFLLLIELIIFSLILYNNNIYFSNTINDIINDLFKNFYFPSIYVYLVTVICTIILFICISINKYISNTYKVLSKIYFYLFNFLNILLINELVTNKINVLKKESLFTNNNVLILLEVIISLFIFYLIINVMFYIANNITSLIMTKKEFKVQLKDDETALMLDEINMDYSMPHLLATNENESIVKDNLSFNDLLRETDEYLKSNNTYFEKKKINLVPEIVVNKKKINLVPEVDVNKKKTYQFIDRSLLEDNNDMMFNIFKNNNVTNNFIGQNIDKKVDVIDEMLEENNSAFTLNDYKLFSKMLRTVLENNNNRNDLTIKQLLDKKILYKYTYEEYKRFEKILNSCMN